MRIDFSAVVSGSIEIPDEDIEKMDKDEREIYINTLVSEEVAEVATENFEWKISEE